MTLFWIDLRAWNGSQKLAFEELCCQLHSAIRPIAGAKFIRKGVRDAGVEGYWQLPDGSEHGIQAKFFHGSPDASQMAQIDDSFKTALLKHPKLTKYTICLPTDRDNPRIEGQNDFMQRWNSHVAKWNDWASQVGRIIDFEYCGESELCRLLALEENAGLLRFWFGKDELSPNWFVRRKNESIAPLIESRYLPDLHVDISALDRCFEGLVHDFLFFSDVGRRLSALLQECQFIRTTASRINDPILIAAVHAFADAVDELMALAEKLPVGTESEHFLPSERSKLISDIRTKCQESVLARRSEWRSRLETLQDEATSKNLGKARIDCLRQLETNLTASGEVLFELEQSITDAPGQSVTGQFLLLIGEAGMGKSHYLARIVESRVDRGIPALLFLGEHFKNEPILQQIRNRIEIGTSNEEFLGALSAIARSHRCRAMIAIDALNESDDKHFWQTELPSFLTTISNYPDICVVLSIRSTYKEYCLPENIHHWQVQQIHHPGFSGTEDIAFVRYFSHYGISPTTPVLQPEFTNPLFLKTFCEAISSHPNEATHAQSSLSSLLELFLRSINERLSLKVFATDPNDKCVQRAVCDIADKMILTNRPFLSRSEAKSIVTAIHTHQDYQKTLYRQLLHEGILTESLSYGRARSEATEYVRFSYERFGDFWQAESLIRRIPSADPLAVKDKCKDTLQSLGSDERTRYENASLIECLLILFAEKFGVEIWNLQQDVLSSQSLTSAVLGSISWRSEKSITDRTAKFVQDCLADDRYRFEAMDCLLCVATRKDHALNAKWFHEWLMKLPMPDRDAIWTIYVHDRWQRELSLARIVDWAWNQEFGKATPCSVEVRSLCGICLCWFFTSSNRFLRDRATKALVALYDNSTLEFLKILALFRQVDDFYVVERIFAAACGIVMRTEDTQSARAIAEAIFEQVFSTECPPAHIMIRDYARLVVERANSLAKRTLFDSQKICPPFKSTLTLSAQPWEELRKKYDDRAYVALVISLWPDSGDFARYVLGSSSNGAHAWASDRDSLALAVARESTKLPSGSEWEHLLAQMDLSVSSEEEDLLEAIASENPNGIAESRHDREQACYLERDLPCRWIFERVFALGWTPERFGLFDPHISDSGRDAHKPERIGKKYQWIAYHEWLAHVSDQRPYRASWNDVFQYEGTWQLHVRDIDPTCLLRSTVSESTLSRLSSPAWWANVEYREWQPDLSDEQWMTIADDLPSVQNLLLSTDPNTGKQYVCLDAYATWESPLLPGRERWSVPFRRVWYILQGYLLKQTDMVKFIQWAMQQDFFGRWMPDTSDTNGIYSREFYWAPAYCDLDRSERNDATLALHEMYRDRNIPCDFVVPTTRYVCEGSGFDCSLDKTASFHLPGIHLAEQMQLRPGIVAGEFVDKSGEVVAFDPSLRASGPSTVLFEKNSLMNFLHQQNYALVWTILGAKETCYGSMSHPDRPTGELQLNGAVAFQSGAIEGAISAHFQTFPINTDSSRRSQIKKWTI